MLEIDSSHKKANVSQIGQALKKVGIIVSGCLILLSAYSGLDMNLEVKAASSVSTNASKNVVNIPKEYQKSVSLWCSNDVDNREITQEDLETITMIQLDITSDASLDFLKYCKNLQNLFIDFDTNDLSCLNTLPRFNNLNQLSLCSRNCDGVLTQEFKPFFNSCSNVKNVSLQDFSIGPEVFKYWRGFSQLTLTSGTNYDFDFKDLKHLKELNLRPCMPYDIAQYLTLDEYNSLISSSVNVTFADDYDMAEYLNVAKKLDKIVKELNIDGSASNDDKLNAILVYVLEHLEYDREVSSLILRYPAEDPRVIDAASKFYRGGSLYGAFETEGSICGNYAALVDALCKRVNVPSYVMDSGVHAWNLVKVEGNVYYVDATWLDKMVSVGNSSAIKDDKGRIKSYEVNVEETSVSEIIKKGEGSSLDWYREDTDPEHIKKIDNKGAHIPIVYPVYMEENQVDQLVLGLEEQGDKKVNITINGNVIAVSVGALVGVLSALGGAILIRKKKRKKRLYNHSDYLADDFGFYDSGKKY